MVVIRSSSDIILQLIDQLRISIPNLDTKPGTVSRDLLIDPLANQASLIYDELAKISNLQSLRLAVGSDLDRLALNFGSTRRTANKSAGLILLTFSSIPALVNINRGGLVISSNGNSFSIINGITVDPANSNFYKSIATKFRADLDFVGITDQFAVEISVQATTPGASGNISKYSIVRTNISSISNVTNVFPFVGGSNQEDDPSFRNRVLAIFSGSSVGTALGFKNSVLTDSSVQDAIVIGPGDPLMLRDGTQVKQNSDGTFNILSEGTGGKVDVVILGDRLTEHTDSFIYRDLSNTNDPTNVKNMITLGQIPGDENKTVTRKRLDEIANGALPAQPVQDILEVTGSLSGSNFKVASVDSFGRVSGNYEVIKDIGVFSGSAFGFDKFHWISNKISLFEEDLVKTTFNGQDNLTFTDTLSIPTVQQNIQISNENSLVLSTDRSIIQLLHVPATNITRIFNVNTGERYVITDQNPHGAGSINTSGQIFISGNTLPAVSDVLQTDYTWIVDYDSYVDYDGKILNNNPRQLTDSADWGMSNVIRDELVRFELNTQNTLYNGVTKLPVSSVVSAKIYSRSVGKVYLVLLGTFAGHFAVDLLTLTNAVDSISSGKILNSTAEIYNTAQNDGNIVNNRVVVNSQIKFNTTIILPIDTVAKVNDFVEFIFNSADVYTVANSTGSFVNDQITIPVSNVLGAPAVINLHTTYIAAIQDLVSATITDLPISRFPGGFKLKSSVVSTGNLNTVISKETQNVQKDNLNNFFIKLNLSSTEFVLLPSQIISVLKLSDGSEIWNDDFPGTITIASDGNYQLVFSGLNSPAIGDHVLSIYFSDDIKRIQPFTFDNIRIKKNINNLLFDFNTSKLFTFIQKFTSDTNVKFKIIDPITELVIVDGYVGTLTANNNTATFTSVASFNNMDNIRGKKLVIFQDPLINNNGTFDILDYVGNTNTLTIGVIASNFNSQQVSVIRLLDGKELWNSTGIIDAANNILTLPVTDFVSPGDTVITIYYNFNNLKQSPTKIITTVNDQVINTGIITIKGTTITKAQDIIFTATDNGLKQNLIEAVKKSLNLNSNIMPANNIAIVRLVRLEKVLLSGLEVTSVLKTFDIKNTSIKNGIFYANETITDESLTLLDFVLPATNNNLTNNISIGDNLRVTFYYLTPQASENVTFTRNGTLYTNKFFALIDQIYITSGFSSSLSARMIFSYFNQPASGTRYKVFYDYTAPKVNERIAIRYDYNSLIADATFNLETSRPINSDVLVRAAKQILINVTMNIVIKSDFINSAPIILQNLKDRLTATINTNVLGDVLNSSSLVAAALGINGVDRARIIFFNKAGQVGNSLTVSAQKDEYFVANNVIVDSESR